MNEPIRSLLVSGKVKQSTNKIALTWRLTGDRGVLVRAISNDLGVSMMPPTDRSGAVKHHVIEITRSSDLISWTDVEARKGMLGD